MGLADPPALPQRDAKADAVPAAAPAAGGKEGGGPGGSRAGTPALLEGGAAGAAACSLAGWRRAVAETPVPGGISQLDLRYTRR